MNGGETAIMNKIVEISTRQEERHVENKADLKTIFKKLTILDNLPCKIHVERMVWFNRYLMGMSVIVGSIVSWIVYSHHLGG